MAESKERQLSDLVSVGPATLEDFRVLGIVSVDQLVGQNAQTLHQRLCELTCIQHDICCQDVFQAAIAQAEDPNLPREKCNWYYWSSRRSPS